MEYIWGTLRTYITSHGERMKIAWGIEKEGYTWGRNSCVELQKGDMCPLYPLFVSLYVALSISKRIAKGRQRGHGFFSTDLLQYVCAILSTKYICCFWSAHGNFPCFDWRRDLFCRSFTFPDAIFYCAHPFLMSSNATILFTVCVLCLAHCYAGTSQSWI